ncbi:MAG: LytTR family DNA-binding domain-containing protein [Bacteroidota bacterium]
MNVLIIEDEKIASGRLTEMLKQIDISISVTAVTGTVRDSIAWLKENSADLIFCDIQLSDGLSFDIFEKTEVNTPIIFTTAYDKYAIDAFRVNSIDYLLKPFDIEKLKQSLRRYENLVKTREINIESLLKSFIKKEDKYRKRFVITIGPKVKIINTEDIAYFFARDKGIFIQTTSGRSMAVDHSLDALEKMMDPELFFRVNRKYLVHINAIDNIHILSKSRIRIILTPPAGEDIIISFERSRNFKNWLNR